jgi:glycosyltransferase involved in cell wall biosynthesis
MKIFCIIPAYNEEKNISKVIKSLDAFVDEIIVIDDCSQDNTYQVASKEKATVLRHVINRGQGAALQTGNDYALKKGADIIVHFDADGQFLAEDIKTATDYLLEGEYDVILGSRFLEKKSNMPIFKEKIIMPSARFFNKLFFNFTLTDPQNGFRVLSQKAAQKIKITNDGSAHCSEILYKIFKYNFKVKEIPITVIYNEFGQSLFGGKGRGKGGLRIIKDLMINFLMD